MAVEERLEHIRTHPRRKAKDKCDLIPLRISRNSNEIVMMMLAAPLSINTRYIRLRLFFVFYCKLGIFVVAVPYVQDDNKKNFIYGMKIKSQFSNFLLLLLCDEFFFCHHFIHNVIIFYPTMSLHPHSSYAIFAFVDMKSKMR